MWGSPSSAWVSEVLPQVGPCQARLPWRESEWFTEDLVKMSHCQQTGRAPSGHPVNRAGWDHRGGSGCSEPAPSPPLFTVPVTFQGKSPPTSLSTFQAGRAPDLKAPSRCGKEELADGRYQKCRKIIDDLSLSECLCSHLEEFELMFRFSI